MPPGVEASDIAIEALPDRIAQTYAGKNVFITGGTGFLGKVLVEKLLRKCPDVKKIMLLVRQKKGKEPKERLAELLSGPLFEKVKQLRGGEDQLTKQMSVVSGDVLETGLGLSEEDREMLKRDVNIFIHAAATVRFDEELKRAVLLNCRGTKFALALAKECKQLQIFIHVSTAYCHLHEKLLDEKPYPPPADPHSIITCMETLDNSTVNAITPKILDKFPNSYAFTKSLSEGLVVESFGQIPAIILRPSIVIPIWQEPIPGWTDNINGPTGLLIGAGKGVIRTMYCHSDGYADFLPVDTFVSALLVATFNYITEKETDKNVYNCTSSAEIKISWHEMIEIGREIIMNRVPLNGVAWYPGGSMKNNRLYHNICVFLFHLLPALFVDTLLYLLRYEPVLMRVQKRINKGFEVFEYYANNQWDFKSDHVVAIRAKLNARELRDYKIDKEGLDISKYFEDCIRAARLYILNEPEDTLPAARRHMKIMWFVDRITRLLFWGFMLWWFTGAFMSIFGFTTSDSGDSRSATGSAGSIPMRDM